jgi:hypothetical protein
MSNLEAVEATKQLRNTRPGGHRIDTVPLIEYQLSPFATARDIRWGDDSCRAQVGGILSLSSMISLAAVISQVK